MPLAGAKLFDDDDEDEGDDESVSRFGVLPGVLPGVPLETEWPTLSAKAELATEVGVSISFAVLTACTRTGAAYCERGLAERSALMRGNTVVVQFLGK